ncbi:hypothetical protein [Mucilaginibacter ginkgonis]|uniref:Uncharacterized protein n=1 Tax=Mucilaginibacter ginkgonis TaxID=2682091 RepID=A0A6I4I6S6_9SPHI|nr:hypothetical protein [Mucilaginibacter ginkgonis]QQL50796.1 hypothetical protein GO620_004885 [Mucilaginibacter ginkgonis]
MKKIALLFIVLCLNLAIKAQITTGDKLHKVKSKTLVDVVCNIDTTVQLINNEIVVRYLLVHNEYGSAKTPETDEESQQIYIAVSTVDDAPDLALYATERMIAPKITSFISKNKTDFLLTYEYGIYNKRKRKTITITPKGCFMSK